MSNFWGAYHFLALILLIVIPVKIQEKNYFEIILVIAITAFLLVILFGLDRFFTSMAMSFKADNEFAYFTYANAEVKITRHEDIQKVEYTPYRYIFFLRSGEKISLSRVKKFSLETEILSEIKSLYFKRMKSK